MEKMGTLEWLETTRGKLALTDRLTMIAQGVQAQVMRRVRPGAKVRHREVRSILPPDSAMVRAALDLCRADSEPWLVNHCLRAYFFARLLDDGARKFDDEALFVALLLHDLGLTDAHRISGSEEQCFTVIGARAVTKLAREHGFGDARARLAAEAITLHLNVVVGDAHGREAQLVREGSGADVAGLGLHRLARDQIAEVVARHPRLSLKREIQAPLSLEARERPRCRTALLMGALRFGTLIRAAPQFSE